MLWLTKTATIATTFTATAAMARPFAPRLPRRQDTSPTIAKTAPTSAAKNEMLLMMGKSDVISASMPTIKPEIASPERGCSECVFPT